MIPRNERAVVGTNCLVKDRSRKSGSIQERSSTKLSPGQSGVEQPSKPTEYVRVDIRTRLVWIHPNNRSKTEHKKIPTNQSYKSENSLLAWYNIQIGNKPVTHTVACKSTSNPHTPPIDGVAAWFSGNVLASINVVALRQTRLAPGWVTVCGWVNHLGM